MPDSGSASPNDLLRRLPAISPEEAVLRGRLFKTRGPLRWSAAGRPFALWCLGEAPESERGQGAVQFQVSVGSEVAMLSLPSRLIQQLLSSIEPALQVDATGDEMLGMLLEHLLAAELQTLETAWNCEIRIARGSQAADQGCLALHLRCEYDGTTHDGVLAVDPALASKLSVLLDRLPSCKAGLSDQLSNLAVTLRLCLGAATLPLRQIEKLGSGDVILPYSPPLIAGEGYVTLADRWRAAASLADSSLTLTEQLHDPKESSMDADNSTNHTRSEIEDSELDDLPVKLVFEIGRCEMTLGELRGLGPGHAFALGRDPEQSVDIVTGGRRIGSGQLVRIGERIGVRVLRLGQDG